MSFIDEVKTVSNEIEIGWLCRWFQRINVKGKILDAAKNGYTEISWDITMYIDDKKDVKERKKHLASDSAIRILKKNIGKEFKIHHRQTYKDFLGFKTNAKDKLFLVISWKEGVQ